MYFLKRLKIFLIALLIIFFNVQNLSSLENKILFKIENEIITTIDIYEEINFLKTFNPETKNLSESELFEISKNSILRDKIKKIEIMNYVQELKVDKNFLSRFIKNKYSKIGINSLENFENYLNKNNLNIDVIKEKFIIELIWNDIIYQKFKKKIIIDREKIREEILRNSENKLQRELLLLEINFEANNKADFKKKYEQILSDIDKIGFKKSALIHSTSETASDGGSIGWVKEDNLNISLKKIISKYKIGEISQPVRTSSGFIILKIEDEKEYVPKLNLANKVEEVVRFKTNDQLNQFSSMYFNKLKKNLIIYGL